MQLLVSQKIEFFNFSGTEKIKKTPKKLKTIQSLLRLQFNHFSGNFNKLGIFFWFFTETLTLWLPLPRCAGDNTDPLSDKIISETVRANINFAQIFSKNIQ